MHSAVAVQMIEHYFGAGAVQAKHKGQLQALLDHNGPTALRRGSQASSASGAQSAAAATAQWRMEMTPAQLEQQCAEFASVDELLCALYVRWAAAQLK